MISLRMKHCMRLGFILLICIAMASSAMAAKYYVAKNGSDYNPGTGSQPWLTIQKAAEVISAGDTVVVGPGTYDERVNTRRSGTPGKRITFMALTSKTVTMRGFDIDHDYISIDGFTITGNNVPQYSGYINFSSSCEQCFVVRCHIHSGAYQVFGVRFHEGSSNCALMENILDDIDWVMINFHGTGHVAAGNVLMNCPGWDAVRFFGSHHTFKNNSMTGINKIGSNHTDLFQTFGVNGDECHDILVESNFAIDCDAQIGNFEDNGQNIGNFTFRNNLFVNITSTANMFCEHMKWYNNTFYNCSTRNNNAVLRFGEGGKGVAHNGVCINNLFIGCAGTHDSTSGWYSIEVGVNNVQTDYNYVAQKNHGSKAGFSEPHGINGGDPCFRNIAANDFRISSDSPAVGSAKTVSGFNADKDGRIRSSLWDRGAYEFVPDKPENMGMEY